MKAISIGHYVGAMGNAVLEQQNFIKKLLNTLQLIKPQSNEFTNQLNKLVEEYETTIENQNIEPNESLAEFDTLTPQIQNDLEKIHVQLRILKSANASSRKGQGQPDLTAIEKNKKLKQSFKEYKAESTSQISDIKSGLSELKSELKNGHEMMTSIQATLQATRDDLERFKSSVPSHDDKEEMNSQVNDMQVELEALKTVLEVMHQGTPTTEDLEKLKKSQAHSVNILKNSMASIKDEIKNIKLLKQGKIPTNILDLVDSLDQSVNNLQDDMEGVKKDVDDKSSVLVKAQQDLESLMTEMERLKANPIEIDTSSLPMNDRLNLIEDRMNTLADHQLKAVDNFNAQRTFLKYLKDEFATEITERVSQLEKRLDEGAIDPNQKSAEQKNPDADEYQHLDRKLEEMIQDLEHSNIQERAVNVSGEKPDFPRTVGELRSFQKALRAQAQDDQQSIYKYIEPSNLPLVVQSIDQLLNEMYSEMYQIRDKLSSEIAELKESSVTQAVKCLKHEVANLKRKVEGTGFKDGSSIATREIDLNNQQPGSMQWPVLRSPGKKRPPNPFVEGLKTKIQDLVEDMNTAEGQEDEDINQIKPSMGEAQAKLNNMLTLCNSIIEYEEEDQIEQITPEKMWQTINELQEKVTSMKEKEEELSIQTRDIQLEESNEMKEAIEELRNTSKTLNHEIKQLKEKTEVQESLDNIDERMNSITERINEISGHQTATDSTLNAHSTRIRQQADQIQDKLNHIEELEQTLNDFISNNAENDHQSIESMKAELEELKDELNTINKTREETDNSINEQINEIHQKLKEFEEGAFFRSSSRANPVVQALQKQISDLIQQMEDSQIKDEEDTTGELRPNLSEAQEQLETVQKTLDEILAQENERLDMESPKRLVKEIQTLNNRVRALEGKKPHKYADSNDLLGKTIDDSEALLDSFNVQTREARLPLNDPEDQNEFLYELKNRVELLENAVSRLNKVNQDTTDLVNKRHNSLKKVKAAVNDKLTNRLDKVEDDLNHHISDHPISQGIQVAVPPDSYVKSKPNPVIQALKQQIDEVIQQIEDEELQSLSTNELSESNGNLKPELDQLKQQLTKLQETLRKIQEQQIYVPAHESLQGIADTITVLQDKLNNQSNIIRELKDQSDIKNNERFDQLNEEIKALKRQTKQALQNDEALTNQIQDSILPLTQKIETLQRRTSKIQGLPDEHEESVIERSVQGFGDSASQESSPRRKSNMNSIEQLKSSITALVEKMDDDKINEEEDTTGELQANIGQTRKDLAQLQTTIDSLLNRANEDNSRVEGLIQNLQQRVAKLEQKETKEVIRTRDIKLDDTDEEELNQLNQNVKKLNDDNEEFKQALKSLKYEVKQLQTRQPQGEGNIQLSEMADNANEGEIEVLKQELQDLRNQFNALNDQENSVESKVNSLQDQVNDHIKGSTPTNKKRKSQAVAEMKDQVDTLLNDMTDPNIQIEAGESQELIQPSIDQAQEDLQKLKATLDNIISQPISDSKVLSPEGVMKLIQENQTKIQTLAMTEEEVNKDLYQLRETLRCVKHEFKALKQTEAGLNEAVKLVGTKLEEHLEENRRIIAEINSPNKKRPNPAIGAVKKQIETLNQKMEDPDFSKEENNDTESSTELISRRKEAQQHLALLNDTLDKLLEQDEPLILNMDTLHQMIHDLQTKIAFLEAQDEQTARTNAEEMQNILRSMKDEVHNLKEEQEAQARDLNIQRDNKLDEIEEKIDQLEKRTNEVTGSQQTVLQFVKAQKSYIDDFKNQQQSQIEQENDIRERVSQLEQTVETIENIEQNLKEIQSHITELDERPAQYVAGFMEERAKTRPINPVIKDIQDRIDELVKEMNDPSLKDEENQSNEELQTNMSKAEAELVHLQEEINRLMEQEEPIVVTPEALLDMVHKLQAQVASLEVSEAQRSQNDQNQRLYTSHVQNKAKINDSLNTLKSNLDDFKNQLHDTNVSEQEMDRNFDDLCQQIEGIQTNINEFEEEPSPAFADFPASQKSRSTNPAIEGIQKRIEGLIKEMNHPSLQNEESEANARLKPSMTKAETELVQLQEMLRRLEEEDLITPNKLYDMIQALESKVDEHIENHPSQWTVMPKEKKQSHAVQDLKEMIDDLCDQMQVPVIDDNDQSNSQLKPRFEKAETELRGLQNKVNDIIVQQDQPKVVTPDTLYENMLQLQSSISRLRKEQQLNQSAIQEQLNQSAIQERSIQLDPQFDELENEEIEGEGEMNDEEWRKATSKKISHLQRSIRALQRYARATSKSQDVSTELDANEDLQTFEENHKESHLESEVEQLKSSVEQLKSEVRNMHNLQSPTKEYRSLQSVFQANPPKNEEELVSYIDRLEKVAEGFDRHIVAAQNEINKVGQIKNQLREDSDFARSLQDELKKHSNAIHCLKHELKHVKQNTPASSASPSQVASPIMSRSVDLSFNDSQLDNNNGKRRATRRNNQSGLNEQGEEEVKTLQERLAKLENKVDSFKATYVGFHPTNETTLEDENRTASVEALSSKINQFVERSIEPESDDEVEKLQPDIENTQNQLRELKGTLDDILNEKLLYEQTKVTPQRLNEALLDVKQAVEKTQNDINEINDKLDTLDENQEQTNQSLNNFKSEVESYPKFTQEILDYINTLPSEFSQINSEIARIQEEEKTNHDNLREEIRSLKEAVESEIQEAKNSLTQDLEGVKHSLGCVKYELKTLKSQVPEIKSDIKSLQDEVNNHSNEITNLHDTDASISQTIDEMKSQYEHIQEQNAQQFKEINESISSIKTDIEVMKTTQQQTQEQNEQQFKEIKENLQATNNEINQMKAEYTQEFQAVKDNLRSTADEIKSMKSESARIQDQNNRDFQSIRGNIQDIKVDVEIMKKTHEKIQEQNEQQFKEIKDSIQATNNEIKEVRSEAARVQEQNSREFQGIKENLQSTANEINMMKAENERIQEANNREFQNIREAIKSTANELKDEFNSKVETVKENLQATNNEIKEMKDEAARIQEQNSREFQGIKDNLQSATNEISMMKAENERIQEANNREFQNIREAIKSTANELKDEFNGKVETTKEELNNKVETTKEELNSKLDTVKEDFKEATERNAQAIKDVENKQNSLSEKVDENIRTVNSSIQQINNEANQTRESLNNLINQRKEDVQKVDALSDEVEALKQKNETEEKTIKEHTKNIAYIQKVLAKQEKYLKTLIEKQKGMEDLFQTCNPVSKDDFQKLEMKYDKLIEQIHSNISVIANGQQSQNESIKKEINNLSQNNSELQSDASLTTSHKEGIDDLTKKITKIFKHVKSQDEKINKLRTDVDGLLQA